KQTKLNILNTCPPPTKRRKPYSRCFLLLGENTKMADVGVLCIILNNTTYTMYSFAVQIFDNFYCIIYSLASCVMCILRISGASSSLAIAADVANQLETTRLTYTTDDRALSFSECRRTSAILIGLCNHRRHDPTVGRFNLNPPLPLTDVTRTCTHTHTHIRYNVLHNIRTTQRA
ncbi:Uncharacterized protein FWK35_00002198, partial [Aphis craccivora]